MVTAAAAIANTMLRMKTPCFRIAAAKTSAFASCFVDLFAAAKRY
jgi:hypothetical protein